MVYCWKCGTALADDASFCYKCGTSVRAIGGERTGFDLLKDDKEIQNHWLKRAIAFAIDVAIVSVVVGLLVFLVTIPTFPALVIGQGFPFWWGAWGFWFGGLAPFLVLAYFVFGEALYGETFGKRILGLRVVRLDRKPMNLWASLVRNISKLSLLLLLLDVAVGLGTHGEHSQKYSDRYIGTVVETVSKITIIQ